jgi:hypothetical protein
VCVRVCVCVCVMCSVILGETFLEGRMLVRWKHPTVCVCMYISCLLTKTLQTETNRYQHEGCKHMLHIHTVWDLSVHYSRPTCLYITQTRIFLSDFAFSYTNETFNQNMRHAGWVLTRDDVTSAHFQQFTCTSMTRLIIPGVMISERPRVHRDERTTRTQTQLVYSTTSKTEHITLHYLICFACQFKSSNMNRNGTTSPKCNHILFLFIHGLFKSSINSLHYIFSINRAFNKFICGLFNNVVSSPDF